MTMVEATSTQAAPPPAVGPIRPSLMLAGADWMKADVSNLTGDDGRRQVSLSHSYGEGAWFAMYAYVTADEARELAAKWAQVADEIDWHDV